MDEPRQVDLVRVPRQEELYDREAVLGRDVSSVFPAAAQQAGAEALDVLKEAIGAKRFVSESELEAIKASRGLSVDDGTLTVDKPLAELLREKKEAKEAAFQEQWRIMKQGKNRPLDEEEMAFLDGVQQQEREAAAAQAAEEAEALEAYRAAVALARGAGDEGGDGAGEPGLDIPVPSSAGSGQQPREAGQGQGGGGAAQGKASSGSGGSKRPPLQALVKVRPKGAASAQPSRVQPAEPGGDEGAGSKRARVEGGSAPAPAAAPAAAAEQQQQQQQQQQQGEGGLAGLIGYGSEDDEDR